MNLRFATIVPMALMLAVLWVCDSPAQTTQPGNQDEIKKIEALLTSQDAAWNRGDIESFMKTYWKSDKLTFSGGGKTTRGWEATLENYQKSYPREKMGKLHFDGLETTLLSPGVALVLGNWHLNINGEKKDGNFSLVMKKIKGEWKIIHDHSSTLDPEKDWLTEKQVIALAQPKFGVDKKYLTVTYSGPWAKIEGEIRTESITISRDPVYLNRETAKFSFRRPDGYK